MATVLVVDDDALSREFMCTLLGYRGHQIREASDGDSALAMVGSDPPDAVITDVLMPGLDGYELARALRSSPTTRHIPIVFSTAHYSAEQIRPLAEAYDVRDVLFKPAHPATVLATIDALPMPGQVSVLSAAQVAEVQRHARCGIWHLDPATNMIAVSPELRDLLGLPSTRLTVDEVRRRVHPDDVATIVTVAENTWRTGSAGTAELRLVDAHRVVRELIVSCHTGPLPGQSTATPSTPSTLWGVAQDVTAIRDGVRSHLQVQVDWHAVRRTVDAFHCAVLPAALPAVSGVGLAAVYLPAPERLDIGAAWYDAVPVGGGRILVSVGRVAGHDRHPAAVMGQVLAALRVYAYDDPDPAGVLIRLNRFLADTGDDDSFATAVVALYDPVTRCLRVANGGHPLPLVVSPGHGGGAVATLVGSAGPALGVLPDAGFADLDLCLDPGGVFCAYTDGLVDRPHDLASAHGRRLPQVAAQALDRLGVDDPDRPPVADLLAESIVRDMLGGTSPDDDVCLAVLRAQPGG